MSYNAYRRMLSRLMYTGQAEFGRKRNEFSTKRDYSRQIEQPDSEVEVFQCEELRIVDDELYHAVQRRLAGLKTGSRGPTQDKDHQLWDLVTELFWCPKCQVRYYQTGAQGLGMQCKNSDLCPCTSAVRRQEAVHAVCQKLCELLQQDGKLIEQIVCRAEVLDSIGDEDLQAQQAALERKVASLSNQIDDLYALAGQGSEDDRKEMMAKTRSVQAERAAARHELEQIKKAVSTTTATITPEQVRKILADLSTLLEEAANGKLGPEAVYKAVAVFRSLVGERIWVHVEPRPGRKQTNVRGTFHPLLLRTVKAKVGQLDKDSEPPAEEVSVWLREPPLRDRLAPRVHQLIDLENHSYRSAAKVLQDEGYSINSGVIWQIYHRYYEMINQPVPERPYNNGRPRKSA